MGGIIMINKHLILQKAIEHANYEYNNALSKNHTAQAKKHHARMQKLMELQSQLEKSGELNQHFKHHNPFHHKKKKRE